MIGQGELNKRKSDVTSTWVFLVGNWVNAGVFLEIENRGRIGFRRKMRSLVLDVLEFL